MYGTEIMDQIVVELLTQKIDKVDQKVDFVASDVKELLKFKWQIIGGSAVISAVVTIIMQIILAFANSR
jgi:hypothetical protein